MRRTMVALLAGTAVGCAGEPTAPDTSGPGLETAAVVGPGSWVARKQYPVDVFDATSATIADPATGRTTTYVIGGFPRCCGNGHITDAVKAYDAQNNTWKAKAPFPVRVRSTNGAAVLDGRIYVSGGFTRYRPVPDGPWRLRTLQTLYVYRPASNTWVRKRDMPEATVNGASVGYQGKLYVATGSVVWRYDPGTDQWSKFAERPERDWWNVSAGLIGGRLYLVEMFGRELDILDLSTGTWTSGPLRPYRACGMASTTLQAKLYLFGSCDDYPTDPETRARGMVFDPAANAWSELTPAPIGAGAGAALARIVVNGKARLSLVMGTRPDNHFMFIP